MICGSDEASIEKFIEINDEMGAKSWFIKHWFFMKHVLSLTGGLPST